MFVKFYYILLFDYFVLYCKYNFVVLYKYHVVELRINEDKKQQKNLQIENVLFKKQDDLISNTQSNY